MDDTVYCLKQLLDAKDGLDLNDWEDEFLTGLQQSVEIAEECGAIEEFKIHSDLVEEKILKLYEKYEDYL